MTPMMCIVREKYPLNLPSSSRPSPSHACCILSCSPCRDLMPLHSRDSMCSGRSVDYIRNHSHQQCYFSALRNSPVYAETHLWILVKIAATSYVGLHRFWRMSRHSSPLAYTLG